MLLHEGDAKDAHRLLEYLCHSLRWHLQQRFEVGLDHGASVLLEEGPHMFLVLSDLRGGVDGGVAGEEVVLQHLEQLLDETTVHLGRLDVLNAHRVDQDLHEALQLAALEEHHLVVAQVSRAQPEEVVDQVLGASAVFLGGEDLDRVRDDKVESLLEHLLVLLLLAELRQAELDRVDEGTDGI